MARILYNNHAITSYLYHAIALVYTSDNKK